MPIHSVRVLPNAAEWGGAMWEAPLLGFGLPASAKFAATANASAKAPIVLPVFLLFMFLPFSYGLSRGRLLVACFLLLPGHALGRASRAKSDVTQFVFAQLAVLSTYPKQV